MAKTTKPQKSILNENTVRRFMKLADIPELSESFFSEDYGKGREDGTTKKGEETEKKTKAYGEPSEGEEDKPEKGPKAKSPGYKPKAYGQKSSTNENLFAEEDEDEALEGELGAEDEIADEEGAELDAEAGEGEAEITPEQAAAVVELAPVIADLAASLEAGGAVAGAEAEVEGEAEVEAGVEDIEVGEEEEEEELAEFRGLEEQLASLGIEVVDDRQLKETVYKRVIKRLTNQKQRAERTRQADRLVERIFARLQKASKKR